MEILYLTSFPPSVRGESWYALNVVKCMACQKGINRISVLTHNDDIHSVDKDVIAQPLPKSKIIRILRVNGILKHFSGLLAIIQAIKQKPDIVHIIGPFNPTLYGGAIGEGLLPFILFLKLTRTPVVLSLHTIYFVNDIYEAVNRRIGKSAFSVLIFHYLSTMITLMMKLSTSLLVVSNQFEETRIARLSKEYHLDARKIRSEMHPFQLSTGKTKKPQEVSNIPDINAFCLCYGFFRREKGFDLAISAWGKVLIEYPDVFLIIAGPVTPEANSYYAELLTLRKSSGLEQRVLLIPRYLSDDELVWLLENTKILIAPYYENHGLSGVLSVSRHFQLPTVSTDIADLRTQFDNIKYWAKPTASDLADAITHSLSDATNSSHTRSSPVQQKSYDFFELTNSLLEEYSRLLDIVKRGVDGNS